MAGKYQAYPEYKDSDVGWFGRIPNEWRVVRQKHLFSILSGYAFKSEHFQKEPDEFPALVTPGSFHQNGGLYFGEKNTYYYNGAFQSEYLLEKGDLLIVMTDLSYKKLILGNCEIVDKSNVLLNQRVGKIIFNDNDSIEINKKYLRYSINSERSREQVILTSTGATVFHSSPEKIGNVLTLLPPISEQQKIVNFLDQETATIDTLIEKQKQLIKLLKEKRQAVISHAVTKGLNPNAPMRDSGVEWLGKVPKGWSVTCLKRYCDITDGSHHSPTCIDDGMPFISVTDVRNDYVDFENCKKISHDDYKRLVREGCKPKIGDVLLTKDGTIDRAAIVIDSFPDFVILSSLGLLTPSSVLINRFLYYYLISGINIDQMNSLIHGSALRRMTISKIDNLTFVLPTKEEQEEIVYYLDEETRKIDELIEKSESIIALTTERRSALISAAVTGKIDVRNWRVA